MKYLKINNLRGLQKTPAINLKPLLLLVGKNSSGKSTFLRTFPLFRQSVEKYTTAPLLFYGTYVDFGSYCDAYCNKHKNDDQGISFEFAVPFSDKINIKNIFDRRDLIYHVFKTRKNNEIIVKSVIGEKANHKTYLKEFSISIYDHTCNICFDKINKITSISINNEYIDHSNYSNLSNGIIPDIVLQDENKHNPEYLRNYKMRLFWSDLNDYIKTIVHPNTSEDTINNISSSIIFGTKQQIVDSCLNNSYAIKSWKNNFLPDSDYQKIFINKLFELLLPSIIEYTNYYFTSFSKNVYYSRPFRASPDRYYRFQELAVEEIDPQGINLAMFLDSLPDSQIENFSEWTSNHFEFQIHITKAEGHASIKIKESSNSEYVNIADIGFGFSQLLPIITQIWLLQRSSRNRIRNPLGIKPTFAIEQPELHLHPKMIAQFADLLCKVININTKTPFNFIIETHSETLINRIGAHVALNNIHNDDVAVVVFDNLDNQNPIRIASYDSDGFLHNWPLDFFQAKRL